MFKRVTVVLILSIMAATVFCRAHAYEITAGLAGSVNSSPYRGVSASAMPFPYIGFESDFFFVRFPSAGVHLYKNDLIRVDFVADYLYTEFTPRKSSDYDMKQLKPRRSSMGAGFETSIMTPLGMFDAGITADILGISDGITAKINYAYPLMLSQRVLLMPNAGLIWENSGHNRYYYGVSHKETIRSGLHSYKPRSGVSGFTGADLMFRVKDRVQILAGGEYLFLSSEITNSPMVDKKGIWGAFAGVMYTF